MSQTLWSKTTLAQAIGLAVTGTAAGTANADQPMPSITLTNYKFNFDSDDFASYFTDNTRFENESADSLKATIPLNGNLDIGVGFSRSLMDGDSTPKYISQTALHANAEYQTLDFEAGYNTTLGSVKTRLSAGLRYIDLDQDTNSTYSYATSPYYIFSTTKYETQTDLKALGLHAGGEASIPLARGLSVSGGIGASVLYGKRDTEYANYGIVYATDDDDDTVYGFDSEVALNYDLSPQTEGGTTVSVGYTYARMYDLIQTDLIPGSANGISDLTREGWFLRLGSTF